MIYEEITLKSDLRLSTKLTFLHFAKAFDTVIYKLLLTKLKILAFDELLSQRIEMFQPQRSMCVKAADYFGLYASATNGVPQGPVLVPLLFLVHIRHVVSFLNFDTDYLQMMLSCTFRLTFLKFRPDPHCNVSLTY